LRESLENTTPSDPRIMAHTLTAGLAIGLKSSQRFSFTPENALIRVHHPAASNPAAKEKDMLAHVLIETLIQPRVLQIRIGIMM
jgi:hypothetical protein